MPEFDFDYDLLCELTETSGVPGYEDRIREIVRRELDGVADEIRTDGMGNVVGTVEGGDYEVAVAAHMDEIGFMVSHVTEEGFVKIDPLGGWDARVLKAQRVRIHTEEGDIPGVIGSPPPHTMDEEDREEKVSRVKMGGGSGSMVPVDPVMVAEVEDVHIDLGLPAEQATERVTPGDLVTMDQTTEVVGEHVTGKALDDRLCVFAMLEAAKRIDPEVTVHFAATVQEEVGLRGAEALGVDLDPDLAIAFDVTVANDIPGFDEAEYVTRLGEGAAIKLKDSSVITNPKVNRRLRELAEERSIPHQLEILPRGGTDTAGFQKSAGAKPVGAISIPTRYGHTVTESAHNEDIAAAIDLLSAFLETETGGDDYTL